MKRMMAMVLALVLCAAPAMAGDYVWKLSMRNNYDVMAIGEIRAITDAGCTIRVDSTVVSAKGDREQLKPATIELQLGADGSAAYVGYPGEERRVGDYVLCCAMQRDNGQFSGFMYKLDSLTKKTLKIQTASEPSPQLQCEVAMLEDFLHSDGQQADFDRVKSEDGLRWEVWRREDRKLDAGTPIFTCAVETTEPLK